MKSLTTFLFINEKLGFFFSQIALAGEFPWRWYTPISSVSSRDVDIEAKSRDDSRGDTTSGRRCFRGRAATGSRRASRSHHQTNENEQNTSCDESTTTPGRGRKLPSVPRRGTDTTATGRDRHQASSVVIIHHYDRQPLSYKLKTYSMHLYNFSLIQ